MQRNSLGASAAIAAIVGVTALLYFWSGSADPEAHSPELVRPAPAPEVVEDGLETSLVDSGARTAATEPAREEAAVAPVAAPEQSFSCAVFGRFLDTFGQPLEGARIAITIPEGEATSGSDGKFRMELEVPNEWRGRKLELVARLAGYAGRTLRPLVDGAELDLGDIVLGAPGSVSGRVVDEGGAGFPGAEVLVTPVNPLRFGPRSERPRDVLSSTTSDEGGEFRVADLAAGEVRVWAGAEGMLWAYTDAVLLRAGEETGDIALRLVPVPDDGVIELVVLDPEGNPVPRAPISYRYKAGGTSGSGSVTADEHGRYRRVLEIAAPFDFSARDPEDRYRPAVARDVQPGDRDVVLQLGERRELAIRVRDLAGNLLPDFSVSVVTREGDRQLSGQRKHAEDEDLALGVVVVQLPVETFEVSVEAEGHQVEQVGPFDPDIVGPTIDVALAPLPGLRGRVVDRAGAPCPGARVTLHEGIGEGKLTVNGFPCRSHKGADASGTADDDGRFTLTFREGGRFFVRAEKEGLAPDEIGPMDLSPDTGSQGLELVLGAGGSIEGEALLPPGQSNAGLIVGISRGDGFGVTGRTDSKGKFRFDGLTPGRWLVERRKEAISSGYTTSSSSNSEGSGEIPWSCEVWEDRTTHFDLDLTQAARVVVEGRFTLSGEPPAGWTASLDRLEPTREQVAEEHTDSQGEFRLELSDPGRYQLRLIGMLNTTTFFFVSQDVDLGLGSNPWQVDVPTGRIEGSVAAGLLEEGDQIQCSWSGEGGLSIGFAVRPDANGAFACTAPAGTVTLSAPSGEKKSVDVAKDATVHVDLP